MPPPVAPTITRVGVWICFGDAVVNIAGTVGEAGALVVGDVGHPAGWKKHAIAGLPPRKPGVRSPVGQPF